MSADLINALIGGMMIGIAASALLIFNGRIMGISGILNGALKFNKSDFGWRFSFLMGLFSGAIILKAFYPGVFDVPQAGWIEVVIGGVLVGVGTTIGSGCTSGHGVCGISRMSPRSLIATLTFMLFGFLTVGVFRHLF